MKRSRFGIAACIAVFTFTLGTFAQTPPDMSAAEAAKSATKAAAKAQAANKQATSAAYQEGLTYINDAEWQKAMVAMQKAAEDAQALQGKQGDAAMYWQAYAAARLAQTDDAMKALEKLKSTYPDSSWMSDADALRLQLEQAAGQSVSPASQPNDDLKLLAINGLMQSDPSQALPLLKKVVEGSASPAVKDRALFVMAQNHSPDAVSTMIQVAQSPSDPRLGLEAVRYLGMMGGDSGRAALEKIYSSGAATTTLKESILRSYMMGGDRARLLEAAKSETNPELQRQAIRYLALAGGKDELWQLYQANPPQASKEAIVSSLGLAGDIDHLIPIAQSEKDPGIRAAAIRALGLSGSARAQDALQGMYTGAQDRSNSEAIIRALFVHNDAAALVALARKENDPELKRDIVRYLSLMHSPVATQYLMEILNQ